MSNEVKLKLEEREDPFDLSRTSLVATTDDNLNREQRLWVAKMQEYVCGNCSVRGDCKPKLWHRASVNGKEIHGDLIGGLYCGLPFER